MEHYRLLTGKTEKTISAGKYTIYLYKIPNYQFQQENLLYIELKVNQNIILTELIDMYGTFNQYVEYVKGLLNETIQIQTTTPITIPDRLYLKNILDIIKCINFNQ
jgi:hypothetical protein